MAGMSSPPRVVGPWTVIALPSSPPLSSNSLPKDETARYVFVHFEVLPVDGGCTDEEEEDGKAAAPDKSKETDAHDGVKRHRDRDHAGRSDGSRKENKTGTRDGKGGGEIDDQDDSPGYCITVVDFGMGRRGGGVWREVACGRRLADLKQAYLPLLQIPLPDLITELHGLLAAVWAHNGRQGIQLDVVGRDSRGGGATASSTRHVLCEWHVASERKPREAELVVLGEVGPVPFRWPFQLTPLLPEDAAALPWLGTHLVHPLLHECQYLHLQVETLAARIRALERDREALFDNISDSQEAKSRKKSRQERYELGMLAVPEPYDPRIAFSNASLWHRLLDASMDRNPEGNSCRSRRRLQRRPPGKPFPSSPLPMYGKGGTGAKEALITPPRGSSQSRTGVCFTAGRASSLEGDHGTGTAVQGGAREGNRERDHVGAAGRTSQSFFDSLLRPGAEIRGVHSNAGSSGDPRIQAPNASPSKLLEDSVSSPREHAEIKGGLPLPSGSSRQEPPTVLANNGGFLNRLSPFTSAGNDGSTSQVRLLVTQEASPNVSTSQPRSSHVPDRPEDDEEDGNEEGGERIYIPGVARGVRRRAARGADRQQPSIEPPLSPALPSQASSTRLGLTESLPFYGRSSANSIPEENVQDDWPPRSDQQPEASRDGSPSVLAAPSSAIDRPPAAEKSKKKRKKTLF